MWWIDFNNIVVDNDKIKILENVMAFGIFDIWWNEIKVERIPYFDSLSKYLHPQLARSEMTYHWPQMILSRSLGLGEKHRCFVLEDKLKMDETDKQ